MHFNLTTLGPSQYTVADEGRSPPESEARDRILGYVRQKPEFHLRQIQQELAVAMGPLQYQQLEMLKNAGKIISTRRGLYKYYFPVGTLYSEKDILQVLSQETARKILIFIIGEGNPTQTDISDKIMISSASGSWHIKLFTKTGLIGEEKKGEYKRYHFNWDSRPVVALMKSYYPSIWEWWSNTLPEMFLSMSKGDEQS